MDLSRLSLRSAWLSWRKPKPVEPLPASLAALPPELRAVEMAQRQERERRDYAARMEGYATVAISLLLACLFLGGLYVIAHFVWKFW